jgi:hypothetical protein
VIEREESLVAAASNAAGIRFLQQLNRHAGTVGRIRHRILWVGLWVGNLPLPRLIRQSCLIPRSEFPSPGAA